MYCDPRQQCNKFVGIFLIVPMLEMFRRRTTLILICLSVFQLILLITINFLSRENSRLKQAIEDMASKTPDNSLPYLGKGNVNSVSEGRSEGTVTSEVINKNPRKFLPSEVTILLLKRSEQTSAFETKLKTIKRMFSASPVKWNDKSSSIGESLNHMVKEIKTEYFAVLEADVSFSNKTNEGITTLWDALERYPEIDFIGGSYLSGDKFHVICQRFKLCKWAYSESYEYKRSLDNTMICDGTSASFMGRTKSMAKVQGGFDAGISDLLVIKDFFVRAKAANVVVATRPSFVLSHVGFKSLYEMWQSRDISKELVSFAIKYKVFIFKDEEGNTIDLCSSTSPLSGKDICIEKNAHKHMLNNGHWAYQGLYTYPFLLGYLKVTLREVTSFFEQHNVNYTMVGGVSLGAVKMHSILPWEAGDIDIFVFDKSIQELLNMFEPWAKERGYVLRNYRGQAVHVFCTPKEIGDVSGGLATIFPRPGPPPKFIKIKTNGIWVRYDRNHIEYLLGKYGKGYLQHKVYRSHANIRCEIKGHNACMPDFQSIFNGKGGTYQEFFCDG